MENQHKDMIGLQPTEPDLLYQKPTNYARRKPMEQTKQEQFIIRRIGGTTYKVRVAFSETAVETMEEKILRMIRNEGVTNDGTCAIMEAPQMSRQSERSAERCVPKGLDISGRSGSVSYTHLRDQGQ